MLTGSEIRNAVIKESFCGETFLVMSILNKAKKYQQYSLSFYKNLRKGNYARLSLRGCLKLVSNLCFETEDDICSTDKVIATPQV